MNKLVENECVVLADSSCESESVSSIAQYSNAETTSRTCVECTELNVSTGSIASSIKSKMNSTSIVEVRSNIVNKKRKSIISSEDEDYDEDVTATKLEKMSAACKTILECIGEDPSREGLVKTPERWAKALLFLNSGYNFTADDVTNGAIFTENHHEMVVVRNIDIHSLCEHHMLPFSGQVHIGYIPNGKIIGLSKLARITDLFARRLQVQERLTAQIADAIVETVQPLGVAVVIECSHFCMIMRGVQKTGTMTTTSSVRGCFETNSKTRAEFFSIIQRK
jgi:GTP cyclohydrolase IA